MMICMSTKQDLLNMLVPPTNSIAKLEEQVQNLTISSSTFEQKITKGIESMQSRVSVVESALARGSISEKVKAQVCGNTKANRRTTQGKQYDARRGWA